MRKLFTDRTAISLFFFLVIGFAVYLALDFSRAARLMPLIVGIPTFILSVAVVVMEILSQWRGKTGKSEGAIDRGRTDKDLGPEEQQATVRREISTVLWLVALVVLIWVLGLLWSIPVFLILFLWLQGREPWRLIISISLGTWVVVYILFAQILKMKMYPGLIQNLWGG